MAIPKTRLIPPWTRSFLFHILNGKSEQVAAKLSQVGTADVKKLVDRDPKFKVEYQEAWDKKHPPVAGGM